jgi:hypothetical protein
MLLFVLLVILGWVTFAAPQPGTQARTVLLVIFVVLMVVWALVGFGAFSMPLLGSKW